MPMNIVIQEQRKLLGLTQEQVADYLGVSTPAVSKWEKGITSPDIGLLPPLARLLKIDLNTLFCFSEDLSAEEIGFFCNELAKQAREDILSAFDTTIITDIIAEEIVSARFDSHIPNYIYDIEDLTIVNELLATLDSATYEVCERPKEPWGSIEAIYITANENEYYLGVIENSAFRVSVNGEGEYYTCSHKDNFLNKLLELQGR